MSVLEQLASSLGVHGQEPNAAVAAACLATPAHLDAIVGGLAGKNARLAGDCAEVLTKVAEARPGLVAPHARSLLGGLGHKNGRVRWESAHALALVAAQVPELVAAELAHFTDLIRSDESVIVRDYVIDAVARWAATGAAAAQRGFPILAEAIVGWESKHAARILGALGAVVAVHPPLAQRAAELAQGFAEHPRTGVRKAAKALAKALARR